jgi:hypothetical protein
LFLSQLAGVNTFPGQRVALLGETEVRAILLKRTALQKQNERPRGFPRRLPLLQPIRLSGMSSLKNQYRFFSRNNSVKRGFRARSVGQTEKKLSR